MPQDWEDWEYGSSTENDYSTRASYSYQEILFGSGMGAKVDSLAQEMMYSAVVEDNDQAYDDLLEYMLNVYGIDLEESWDWVDFRTWYDQNK